MSSHADLFQSGALDLLMEHFSDSGRVTYTPPGGSAVAVSAIVGNETAEDSRESDGLRRVRRRKLTISRDPSGDFGGVAAPVQTGTVAIDGEVWAIESIKCLSRDVFDLVAVRHEAQARSRADLHGPGFRRENQ